MAKLSGQTQAVGTNEAPTSTRLMMSSLALAMLLAALGTSIANVGLPALARAFGAAFQDVQWVVIAYLLAITCLIVGAGKLGDLAGRRRLFLVGIAVFTLASAVCSIAPSLWVLIAARAVQGIGAAVMMAMSMAIVGGAVLKARVGSAMGLLGTTSAIGTALGPTLGGILISAMGWHAIFLVCVPLGMLAFVLAYHTLPSDPARPKAVAGRFDISGTLLLALTLCLYALAMTIGRGQFGLINIALLVTSVVGAALFVAVEARVAAPLVRLAMLREPLLGAGLAMSALVSTVVMASLVVGPFYLAGALHLDAALVGIVMSVGPLVAAFVGVPAGRLVDRFGSQRLMLVGLGAMTAGAVILAIAPESTGVPGYLVPLAVVTAGYALFQTANNTSVMARAASDQRGVVSGLLNLSRNLGLITGASAMGAVFAVASSASDLASTQPEEIAIGMRLTFAVAAALTASAIAIALRNGAGRSG